MWFFWGKIKETQGEKTKHFVWTLFFYIFYFFISISSISVIFSYASLHANTSYIQTNPCILVNRCIYTAHTCIHVKYIYMYTHAHTHTKINMNTYIYETMWYIVYCSKFHTNKIHTYRLLYFFPLHLFSKILLVVFIERFNKVGLFKLFWNLISLRKALIE